MKKINLILFSLLLWAFNSVSYAEIEYNWRDSVCTHEDYWKGTFKASYNSLQEAEDSLYVYYTYTWNERFTYFDEFIDFLHKEPASIDYNFDKLSRRFKDLEIHSSENGNFRSYHWNNETGGKCYYYTTVYQYRSNDSVYTMVGSMRRILSHDTSINEFADEGDGIVRIHQFYTTKGKLIYIIETDQPGGSNYLMYGLQAVTIENDNIVPYPLFRDKPQKISWEKITDTNIHESSEHINFYQVNEYLKEHDGEYITWETQYNADTRTMRIPVINEDFKITGDNYIYVFDGDYFWYKGIENF